MTRSNAEVAKLWIESLRNQDVALMDSLLAPGATIWHSHDDRLLDFNKARQTERDAAAAGQVFEANNWSDFSCQLTEKGALIEFTLRDWSDQPAPIHTAHVLTIKDGLVAHNSVYIAVQAMPSAATASEDALYQRETAPASQVGMGRPL